MTVPLADGTLSPWLVYIVRCADGTLYTGCTNNLEHRLATHNSGKGAHYTKGRGPVTLLYTEAVANRSEAQKREYEIKQLSKAEKVLLIQSLTHTSSLALDQQQ